MWLICQVNQCDDQTPGVLWCSNGQSEFESGLFHLHISSFSVSCSVLLSEGHVDVSQLHFLCTGSLKYDSCNLA